VPEHSHARIHAHVPQAMAHGLRYSHTSVATRAEDHRDGDRVILAPGLPQAHPEGGELAAFHLICIATEPPAAFFSCSHAPGPGELLLEAWFRLSGAW